MDKQVRVYLPEDMISRIETRAEAEGISRSAYIKRAIEVFERGGGKINVNTNNHRNNDPIVWNLPANGKVVSS